MNNEYAATIEQTTHNLLFVHPAARNCKRHAENDRDQDEQSAEVEYVSGDGECIRERGAIGILVVDKCAERNHLHDEAD